MDRPSRIILLGSLLAASIGWQSPWAAAIDMPAGSTVWMKFEGAAGPASDGGDIAGSNHPGLAPPNGLNMVSATDAHGTATGYAEILPGSIRTFIYGTGSSAFMGASFQDTYTVGGTAAGPFDITVQFRVTGSMNTTAQQITLAGANIQAKIGTFQTFTDGAFSEGLRVSPFDAGALADTGVVNDFSLQVVSLPVDIMASYTKTGVNVNDVFDIAYSIRSALSRGQIDLRNTGTISFDLPEGVFLTSALAQSLVPEPDGFTLLAAGGLSLAAVWLTRRRLHQKRG